MYTCAALVICIPVLHKSYTWVTHKRWVFNDFKTFFVNSEECTLYKNNKLQTEVPGVASRIIETLEK